MKKNTILIIATSVSAFLCAAVAFGYRLTSVGDLKEDTKKLCYVAEESIRTGSNPYLAMEKEVGEGTLSFAFSGYHRDTFDIVGAAMSAPKDMKQKIMKFSFEEFGEFKLGDWCPALAEYDRPSN